MSHKTGQITISDVYKVVLSLQNKITSLEITVIEQNKLINKLINEKSDPVQIDYPDVEGNAATEPAHDRAAPAISGGGRRTTGRPVANPASAGTTSLDLSSVAPTTVSAPATLQLASEDCVNIESRRTDTEQDKDGEWIEVKRSRHPRRASDKVTLGTAVPSSSSPTSLSAAERKTYLHLYYVKLGTTVDEVLEYLRYVCSDAICTAETLKARGDYASFKLCVPTKHLDKYLCAETWPEDVCVKLWRNGFRKQNVQTAET